MNLPLIIGNEPIESLVVLYGFIQQYMLFQALSGQITTGSISFLNELATVFSMIGMLILIFSPSLWKAKYLVSWIFLFVVVYLGGSTGGEFGYDFAKLKGFAIINSYKADKDINACTISPGDCDIGSLNRAKSSAGTAVLQKVVKENGGNLTTYSKVFYDSATSKYYTKTDELMEIDDEGFLSKLNFTGFAPQVVILYVTNKLRYALIPALRDINKQDFLKKRAAIAQMLKGSVIPNEQIKKMVNVFDNKCKGLINNASTKDIISADDLSKFENFLNQKQFNLADSMEMNKAVNTKINPKESEPLFTFSSVEELRPYFLMTSGSKINGKTVTPDDIQTFRAFIQGFTGYRTKNGKSSGVALTQDQIDELNDPANYKKIPLSNYIAEYSKFDINGSGSGSFIGAFTYEIQNLKENNPQVYKDVYNKILRPDENSIFYNLAQKTGALSLIHI